jgi:hypothetical protein
MESMVDTLVSIIRVRIYIRCLMQENTEFNRIDVSQPRDIRGGLANVYGIWPCS